MPGRCCLRWCWPRRRPQTAATRWLPPGHFPARALRWRGDVTPVPAAEVADQVAGLSLTLASRLRDAAAAGGGSACAAAAACAGRMHELLALPG